MPEEREVLIMSVIAGRSVSIHADRSLAGRGSRLQVLMDIILIVCFTQV